MIEKKIKKIINDLSGYKITKTEATKEINTILEGLTVPTLDEISKKKKGYVLSSCVITSPGAWKYDTISITNAKKWLKKKDWKSYIGYKDTAQAATELLGVDIPYNRENIQMKEGEEALVFRLVFPPDSPGIPTRQKGKFTKEFVKQYCEVGILQKQINNYDKDQAIEKWHRIKKYISRTTMEADFMGRNAMLDSNLEKGWLSEQALEELNKFFKLIEN